VIPATGPDADADADADVRVRTLDVRDEAACAPCDAWVRAHADGTPFHLSAWGRAVAAGAGHRPHYLVAERGGAIVGMLPLSEAHSPVFGRSLASNTLAVYGGPLADDAATHAALDEAAWAHAQAIGVRVLEYRDQARLRPDWPAKSDVYATFKRPLGKSEDDNLKAIPRKQRAEVRKSLEFGLETRIGRSKADLSVHFRVYGTSVRNLGTPVFPPGLFAAILREFGEDADVLTVYKDGAPLASVLSLYYNGEVLPYYGGGMPEARTWRANDHMYWQLMEHARKRGCTGFDFGRSKYGTGPFSFKKNWGFEPAALHYEYRLAEGEGLPDLSPNNPKYKAMIAVWTKLPLWLSNRIGPLVSRGLS